jgi:hypothetical protein
MAQTIFGPRKRRTREHIIADQSVNHLERFIIVEGHTTQRVDKDYGYDLFLITFDERGYAEPGLVWLQLKAAETLRLVRANYVFDVDIRDYNLWRLEELPVFLILFDAGRRRGYWLDIQRYFEENPARRPKKSAKMVRVRVPARQVVTRRAIAKMRARKEELLRQAKGEDS